MCFAFICLEPVKLLTNFKQPTIMFLRVTGYLNAAYWSRNESGMIGIGNIGQESQEKFKVQLYFFVNSVETRHNYIKYNTTIYQVQRGKI